MSYHDPGFDADALPVEVPDAIREIRRGARRGGRHRRRSSRRRRIGITIAAFLGVLVLAAAALVGYSWRLNGEIRRVDVAHLSATAAGTADTENILMVGSTDRCVLKNNHNPSYGECSQGVTGINSDVVMIVHLDGKTHSASLLSIPRDLFAPNARAEGAYKIDAALYEGPGQLVAAVRDNLGISIQHYVELNFDTFAKVVDALGGVKVNFPEPVFDGNSGLNIAAPGCVELDGVQSLQLVRARHLRYRPATMTSTNPANWPYDPQSDLSRIRRNHEFLKILATSVQKRGLGDLAVDNQIVSSVAPNLEVDSGMSASHMVDLVLGYHNADPATAPQLTLPVVVDLSGTYYYKGSNEGDVVWPDIVADRAVIRQVLGLAPGTNTLDGSLLPAVGSFRTTVVNGSGANGQAGSTAASLGALGFQASAAGDSTPVGNRSETVVYYGSDTAASSGEAQQVADHLTGNVIIALDPAKVTPGAQVTVVTGSHFGVVAPPAPTVPTSRPTTTQRSRSGTNDNQQTPTPAVQPAAPWDPTACPSTTEAAAQG
ncbi:MAG: LCP family protein [Actinobacteria bacterium]|nr:LCP family protein [Actinomycetota bacterium]